MRILLVGATALTALALWAGHGEPQERHAEVRGWNGQSWRIAEPSLEVPYTVLPEQPAGRADAGEPPIIPQGGAGSGGSGMQLFGSVRSLGALFARAPTPVHGRRQAGVLTLHQAGVARHVALDSVVILLFTREPVQGSSLPPYVAPRHFRYAATVALTDGSHIEGDYVNLGTAVLRGRTPEGHVEIPWQDIEVVRFGR